MSKPLTTGKKLRPKSTPTKASPIGRITANVDSEAVVMVDYFPQQKLLGVQWKGSGYYLYSNVPYSVWSALQRSKSVGAYLNRYVKPKYPLVKSSIGQGNQALSLLAELWDEFSNSWESGAPNNWIPTTGMGFDKNFLPRMKKLLQEAGHIK